MTDRLESTLPFVGLHAHTVGGSPFDALGYATEHMNSAYANGLDAMAITDHGNQNALAEMVLHAKKMEKAGKEFKPIYGVEAYFHPSIEQWKADMEEAKQNKKNAAVGCSWADLRRLLGALGRFWENLGKKTGNINFGDDFESARI